MDRIWQWAWDRYGARYSWAICAIAFACALPVYLVLSFVIVAFEKSDHYVEAAAVTVVAVLVMVCVWFFPATARRLVEQWAAGHEVDRARRTGSHLHLGSEVDRPSVGASLSCGVLLVVVGAIAGATGSRLVQYAILGAVVRSRLRTLIAVHSFAEGSAATGQGRPRR